MHYLREDRLTQEREHSRQQKVEKESLQFLKAQQKLIGKKSTDEFERIRIVRPQDRTSRHRNLHQNGKPLGAGNASTELKARTNLDRQGDTDHHSGRLQSARGERTTASALSDVAPKKKPRPQSAKPVLQNVKQHAAAVNADAPLIGQRIGVRRLESYSYNPASLSTTANILSTSQSAPRLHMPHSFLRRSTTEESKSKYDNEKSASTAAALPFEPSSLVTEAGRIKHHIVVHMQRL
uniref:Uncharacterized protein n=1 Tax=Globisporangium ultimum (strain ATCC 200006 / CBS 805.95 / DAOM BR144) TaxID=431595 RepID=K3WZV6_GLOUD